ncbi:MAG: molybdopterin dinucleotide binding domain-containing protein, partial [Verrucomicrobiota bacterium]
DIEQPEEGKLLLMTMRSHDQYNTTIYGLNDRYRGIQGERRVIFLNKADIDALNLETEQIVNVTSHYQGQTRSVNKFLVIPYDIPKSCAAMYFPEANPLVPLDHTAKLSETPASKSIQITLSVS